MISAPLRKLKSPDHYLTGVLSSVKQAVKDFRTGFPDAQVTIEHILCEGDMVAFRSVIRGTHQQPFAGFYPTGKEVVFRGTDFIRIANGKLVEL